MATVSMRPEPIPIARAEKNRTGLQREQKAGTDTRQAFMP